MEDATMEAPAITNISNSVNLGMTGLIDLSKPSETNDASNSVTLGMTGLVALPESLETDDACQTTALETTSETDDTLVKESVLESVEQAHLESTSDEVPVTEETLVVADAVDDEPQNTSVDDVVAAETAASETVVDVTEEPPAPVEEDASETPTDDDASPIVGPKILRPLNDRHRISSPPKKSAEPERAAGQHLLKKSDKTYAGDSNSDDAINSNPSEATGDAGAEARKLDSGKVVPAAETIQPKVYKTAFTGVSPFDFAMQQRAKEKERRQKEKMDREALTRHHAQVVQIESATELKKKQQEELRLKREAEDLHKTFKNDAGPSQFDTAGNLKKLALEQKNAKKEAEQRNHEFQANSSFVIRK